MRRHATTQHTVATSFAREQQDLQRPPSPPRQGRQKRVMIGGTHPKVHGTTATIIFRLDQ